MGSDVTRVFSKFHLVSVASSITRQEKERAAIQINIRLPKLGSLFVYFLSRSENSLCLSPSLSLAAAAAAAACTLQSSCEKYPENTRSKVYARALPNHPRNTCPFASRNTYLRIEEPVTRFPRDMAFRAALRGLVDSSGRFPGGFETAGNLSRRSLHLHLYDFR